MQRIFTLDFSFATLGVQGIAVSPIHTPSMEFVTGFSSFERGKKKNIRAPQNKRLTLLPPQKEEEWRLEGQEKNVIPVI